MDAMNRRRFFSTVAAVAGVAATSTQAAPAAIQPAFSTAGLIDLSLVPVKPLDEYIIRPPHGIVTMIAGTELDHTEYVGCVNGRAVRVTIADMSLIPIIGCALSHANPNDHVDVVLLPAPINDQAEAEVWYGDEEEE